MITKIKANKSFRGTTKYVLEKEKAQIIGGNMYGITTDKLVEQFTLSAHLNPQLQDPCYHLMLSIPKTDRTLNDEELARISERYFASVVVLSRLKGEEAQVKQPDKRISDTKLNQLVDEFIETELPAYDFFIARHSDKKHDHTHIVASRVNNLDGKSIRSWNNYAHSEHSARLLEREFNLTPVQSSWESKRKAMTRNQLERVESMGLPGEEIMRRAIELVAVNKPIMPQFIERLWREHQVKAVVSYYSHGGVRGIKFGIDIGSVNEDGSPRLLWKQGGNLNKYKCSFSKLQTELGINYDPKRDDNEIKCLNKFLESVNNNQNNQQVIPKISAVNSLAIAEINPQIYPASSEIYQHDSLALPLLAHEEKDSVTQKVIKAIVDYVEQSAVESVLAEAVPLLSQSIEQYRQGLAEANANFKDLITALTPQEKDSVSQKAIKAIVDYIEQSAVESFLAEAVPSLSQSIDQYCHSLAEVNTNFKELIAALTPVQEDSVSQKAIKAIVDYVEQSAVESVLVEAVPSLSQSIDQYRQGLAEINANFKDLITALTPAEKDSVSQKAIKAIVDYIEQSAVESVLVETVPLLSQSFDQYRQGLAEINATVKELTAALTDNLTADKTKLNPEVSAELYKHYSADLHSLLVTDRDKEIAYRALLDSQPIQNIEEIILASPAGWTHDEAKALVLIAQNKLADKQSQSEQQLDDKQHFESEYLAIAVPVAVKLINWQLREKGEQSFRFKRATLSKQGRELVFTHDERGEIFRVKVNRKQSGELEYSPINIGKLEKKDIQFWHDCDQLLQEIIEEQQQQKLKSSKGLSR
ncbi:relaxase (plasmid) [Nostoc sp. CENA543]|uniref:relaxase/mobilization nuclease domain-containing protein n=1 Tax=Nostoc sp. CENA543 TaxID=1869241 RepID=UPI000CA2ABDA|nr:relaxase/mobilization nuclease domain-containing protein [Nostoc sp. CENA543]AUT04673.1 relaxase [Nostoc sp. CENA543]